MVNDMFEIKVKFRNGMDLSWSAKSWDTACELHTALKKKFKNAKSVKIWKLN